MHRGYLKLYRKLVEWEWYKDIPVRVLFEHCLIKANIKDKNWKGITIKKGSFVSSLDNLAFETGLSKMQVRTALKKLKSTHEITHKTTHQYSIITVNNWHLYQPDNTQDNTQITHEQHTDNTQITLTKEIKNNNNEKNIISLPEKKLDPFINPIKTFFVEEYLNVFKKTPRLSSFECNRLIELASNNPDIKELIPIAIQRLKKIDFKDINYNPTANWLLKGNNFERVINGEFEPQKSSYERLMEKYGGSNG